MAPPPRWTRGLAHVGTAGLAPSTRPRILTASRTRSGAVPVKTTRQENHATLFPLLARGHGKPTCLIMGITDKRHQAASGARSRECDVKTEWVFGISQSNDRRRREVRDAAIAMDRMTLLRDRVVSCLIGGTGLLLVIVGSFLPWVVSGTVRRSSYAIAGIADRLGIAGDGVVGILVASWPFVGVLCMTPVIAACLRWWRTSGLLGVLIGLAAGLLSFGIVILTAGSSGLGVRLDPFGPAVMAAGSILLLAGGCALAVGVGSPIRRTRGRKDANFQQ